MNQSIKTPRWGIVGLGKIARHFIHDLQLIENIQIGAVASRTLEKLRLSLPNMVFRRLMVAILTYLLTQILILFTSQRLMTLTQKSALKR